MAKRKLRIPPKYQLIALILVIAVAVVGYVIKNSIPADAPSNVTGTAEFHFIDIGQGDSSLIVSGSYSILIDTGIYDERHNLVEYIGNHTASIDYLVLTHPHSDHIGSAATIIRTFDVKNVIMTDVTANHSAYRSLLDALEDTPTVNVIQAEAGQKYTLGELTFELLTPIPGTGADYDSNNSSIVLRVDFGETSVLYTGDAEKEAERDMVKEYGLGGKLDCDILKVGHHGSYSSSSDAFMKCVTPEIGVISCGKNNDYGHPHRETVAIMKEYNVTTYRTDELGSIVITTDGKTFTVK